MINRNDSKTVAHSQVSSLPWLAGPRLPQPKTLPSKYDPYLIDPILRRHLMLNNQAAVVNAKLCHDLFALPYDRTDINTVPFNRTYKREKLLLLDNPVSRTHSIRQSLTDPKMHLTVTSGELVGRSVARIKRIYSKNNPIVLDHTSDKAKLMRCRKIEKSLPANHRLAKPQGQDSKRKEDLIEYEEEVRMVTDLNDWQMHRAKVQELTGGR